MKDKLRILLRIALVLFLVCGVTVGVLYVNRDVGIPTDQLEQDMRTGQGIPDGWTVQTSAGDTTAAGIAYAPDHSDYVHALYIDRNTHRFFTTGWFGIMGGSLFEISDFVAAFTVYDRPETAYISMNAEKIDRAVIDNGTETRIIELDSTQPFALVLPRNSGQCDVLRRRRSAGRSPNCPMSLRTGVRLISALECSAFSC